jgi:hypothetical protein
LDFLENFGFFDFFLAYLDKFGFFEIFWKFLAYLDKFRFFEIFWIFWKILYFWKNLDFLKSLMLLLEPFPRMLQPLLVPPTNDEEDVVVSISNDLSDLDSILDSTKVLKVLNLFTSRPMMDFFRSIKG